jgi:eukaryotic-like serine/threonine-protein kinase
MTMARINPNLHRRRYVWKTPMPPSFVATPRVPYAPDVDPVALFRQAEQLFQGIFSPERLVAVWDERALFLARDLVLKRRVALRVHLLPDTTGRRWFERETEVLAALDHPVLRQVYSAGYRDAWAYRVAKWIDGESLLDAVARGPRPIPAVVQLARNLLSLLEYAHAQRIVIRRIVPGTLMLDMNDQPTITDMRFANPCLDVAGPDLDPTSPPFLAPEVRRGESGEPASDLYTAAALLYFAVTGREPSGEPEEIVAPCALRETCPRAIERIIMRALKRDPPDRYLTAQEMGDDLLSDLGDFELQGAISMPRGALTEDSRSWEKRLRRALGDDYEMLRELGRGAFGRVYLVRDLELEREVALKVLHPYLTSDPAVMERFRREAQLAAQLAHPNIVSIYDTGGRAGLLWYTMAYVDGVNLAALVKGEGPQPVARVLRWLRQALSALQHAHAQGVVHRDLKPENVMIAHADGSVRITDFGLALAFAGQSRYGGASSHSGTPEFAAPEQLLGEPVDHRADLYAISVVALFALTGLPPFGGGSIESILARQTLGRLPDVKAFRDDVPDGLLEVIYQGAARLPAERFASAAAYAAALQRKLQPWWARAFLGLGRSAGAAER